MSITLDENDTTTQELCNLFLNLPFNRLIGLQLESIEAQILKLGFGMQEQLIGNTFKRILHGGVIASVMDSCGGLHALAAGANKMPHLSYEEKAQRLSKGSTIDMRIDFLRPGKGTHFTVSSELLRSGRRVTVTRMKLLNELDQLIAAGSASYLIESE